ncbi:MAG TPA: nucleoside deaminase, partial [Pyrinomonadaceae bacterium]
MNDELNYQKMLDVAIEEARIGLEEGGIPIGAALFDSDGNLLGKGHNRRIQEDDPSVHGETDAFRKAG